MPTVNQQQMGNKPALSLVQQRPKGIDPIENLIVDIDEDPPGIRCLVYGNSGTGKTTFWATFPDPILVIITSGGIKSGELLSLDKNIYRNKIKRIDLQESAKLEGILNYVKKSNYFKTVVFDHATGLQDLILKDLKGWADIPSQMGFGYATRNDWGTVAMRAKTFIRSFINLPINVVVVAQEKVFDPRKKEDDDVESSDVVKASVGPAVTPSLGWWLNNSFDYVVQTFKTPKTEVVRTEILDQVTENIVKVKGTDYCLRCEAPEVYLTKFRVPLGTKVPEVIVNPTYNKVFDGIRCK